MHLIEFYFWILEKCNFIKRIWSKSTFLVFLCRKSLHAQVNSWFVFHWIKIKFLWNKNVKIDIIRSGHGISYWLTIPLSTIIQWDVNPQWATPLLLRVKGKIFLLVPKIFATFQDLCIRVPVLKLPTGGVTACKARQPGARTQSTKTPWVDDDE